MANEMTNIRVRLSLALATLSLAWLFVTPFASAEGTATQHVFPSSEVAVDALIAAVKADDMKALSSILGPDADQVLSSGDPVADKNVRNDFMSHYQEMHRLAYDDQGRVVLYIGAGNWPVPIPLIKKNGGWVFDTAAGKDELLFRRIGRNELFTIKVLEDLADAQTEYASDAHDGEGAGQFTRKILSDSGKQDGLYWEAAEGQAGSPIGPLVASALRRATRSTVVGILSRFMGTTTRYSQAKARTRRAGQRTTWSMAK